MDRKFKSGWLAALLGIVIGALLMVVIMKWTEGKRRIRAEYTDWRKLNLVLQEVQKHYVDTIDVVGMTDAAVEAALARLDPHSVYLPPVDLEESETELAGNFDGIGIQFNVPNDTAIVLEVIAGGPSEKAGLMPGDRLIKVGDQVIAGVRFPQDSMVRRMKGPAGTKVKITAQRGGEQTVFEITRGKIPVHSVDAAFMVDATTGYVRLAKFSRTTYQEVSQAVLGLLGQGMERLVFDLRDNSGGYFDQALLLSNMFLRKGADVVYLEGLHHKRENFKADGRGLLQDISLAVLINESSASSSEIFAGAMQDNDRGLIIGRRSFGKGLVQEPVYFTDGSAIRLTVARFYTPSGRCIQKPYGGLEEDYRYDLIRRYSDGEMFDRDSMKVDTTAAFRTAGGRTVYGGGGIIPDIFVPVDTTRATDFFVACRRKATPMRFASDLFDQYRSQLIAIEDFDTLNRFLDGLDLPTRFIRYAATKDRLTLHPGEWEETESYLMPWIRALVGRYSKLGENAYFKLYLPVDDMVRTALESPFTVDLK